MEQSPFCPVVPTVASRPHPPPPSALARIRHPLTRQAQAVLWADPSGSAEGLAWMVKVLQDWGGGG